MLEIFVTAFEFMVMAVVVFGSGLVITGRSHPALERDTTSPVLWMAE